MKGKYRNITIMSVHAPMVEKEEREEGEFYECSEETYQNIQMNDLVITMWDFNAKIGKDEYQKKVAGKYSIHDMKTRNGLKVYSTTFPHKGIHLGMWKIQGSSETIQIDHVLVLLRHYTSIINMKSSRGLNCDTHIT
jgi:endonuclease/exonuclease/phosphatase family metal-dependent hydrolase